MQLVYKVDAVVDLDAAAGTSAAIIKSPGDGYIFVKGIFARFEEAVAAGGFSSAAGVASIEINSVEVATWSTGVAATARSIGDTVLVTVDGTNVTSANGHYKVTAGQTITVKTKTQGTGGTVTGTVRFNIPMDINLT